MIQDKKRGKKIRKEKARNLKGKRKKIKDRDKMRAISKKSTKE